MELVYLQKKVVFKTQAVAKTTNVSAKWDTLTKINLVGIQGKVRKNIYKYQSDHGFAN